MSRYDRRIIKLYKAMNNILYWWEKYDIRVDSLIIEAYPFNVSYDEIVFIMLDSFEDILLGKGTASGIYDTKETNISRVNVMLFAELRDMCELINDFYKYDKERFLSEFPHCYDGDLLEKVVVWHNVNVVKHGSSQQKEYTINLKKEIKIMKYYDIHVKYGKRDRDGYSIPIAIENGNEEEAIAKAKENDLFEFEEDIDDIDYVNEIDEEYYKDMIRC